MNEPLKTPQSHLKLVTPMKSLAQQGTLSVFPVKMDARADKFAAYVDSKFNELCALPWDWDGYGGISTVFDIASFSAALLGRLCAATTPLPAIVPLSGGGVQIEWHLGNIDLELLIHRPNEVKVWAKDHSSNSSDEEFIIRTDISKLIPWINKLAS